MSTIKTIVQIGDIYISLVGERYGDPSTTPTLVGEYGARCG